eukprot:CAMPEP_0115260686 /NCGR_PEP_ID=MMETSP0270-20121206/48466_1 /TAXON_ID=71861 /ORGANISM="Scrippsiella trochoidea, Strain CCMP3099" /LENGTH=150 /DNA_ID=CAMNT_0002676531 /DNA_START=299 /DNA_END=750 /DNA_ORIENTATION=+
MGLCSSRPQAPPRQVPPPPGTWSPNRAELGLWISAIPLLPELSQGLASPSDLEVRQKRRAFLVHAKPSCSQAFASSGEQPSIPATNTSALEVHSGACVGASLVPTARWRTLLSVATLLARGFKNLPAVSGETWVPVTLQAEGAPQACKQQ